MDQKNKEKLIQIICAMFPYGLNCYYTIDERWHSITGVEKDAVRLLGSNGRHDFVEKWEGNLDTIKIGLRPLSTMTEKEKEELYTDPDINYLCRATVIDTENKEIYFRFVDTKVEFLYKNVTFFFKKKFDILGLIEQGLAKEYNYDNDISLGRV